MKHLTILVFLILGCSCFQNVNAQAADRWVDVSPKDELFTIQMPADPPAKTQQNNFEQTKLEGRIYEATGDGVDYTVWSLNSKANPTDIDAHLDACADLVWESLLKPLRDQIPKESKLVSEMTYHGELNKVVPGREYLITLGNKPGLARFYFTGKQIYVLTVLYAKPDSAGAQRFMKSFSLKLPDMKTATSLQEDSAGVAPARIQAPSGIGIGTGMGVGSGLPPATDGRPALEPPQTGVGTGIGIGPGRGGNVGGGDRQISGAPAAGPSGTTDDRRVFTGREVTAKARVLSKPEPQYTESARKYGVRGTVILRCVFSSSREVTNLSVRTKLPHGLTQEALRAARKIKFTPAVKDGREVSMYIQLEYNFNLY
ncbi:MAG TPA: energy transducer TonB [Pyrinomonadaceae bacterium]|jgi:TonB family protein|nr:energy transducer TonB [Pyrinomonadaceae bacterium]